MKYWVVLNRVLTLKNGLHRFTNVAGLRKKSSPYLTSYKKELEEQIEDRMKDARNNLLENFDEEVREKLRVNLQESKEYLSKYEYWLWEITKHYLEPYAHFAIDDHSFLPYVKTLLPVKRYILAPTN